MLRIKTTPEEILSGPILKTLLKLAVPTMIAFSFHTAFNFVDRLFVSRLGDLELGALGMAFTVQSIMIAVGAGVSIGATSLIARLIGAGKVGDATRAAEHVLLVILGFSVLFMAAGPVLSRSFYRVLGTSEAMTPHVHRYLDIILMGSFFQFFAMIGNGILRGEGNTVAPMQTMMIGTLVNIVLDPILIFGLGPVPALGVRGAALATVLGRVASTVSLIVILSSRKNIVRPGVRLRGLRAQYFSGILRVGGPTILANLSNSLGLSLLFVLLRPYGDLVKTSFTMGFTYQQIAFLPILGIAGGVLSMTGQNFGAGKTERLRAVGLRGLAVSTGMLVLISGVIIVGRGAFIRVFSENPEILNVAKPMLLIMSLGFPFMAGRRILVAVFQGLGMGLRALLLSSSYIVVFAMPLALLLGHFAGLKGIWGGLALANALTAAIGVVWTGVVYRRLSHRFR